VMADPILYKPCSVHGCYREFIGFWDFTLWQCPQLAELWFRYYG